MTFVFSSRRHARRAVAQVLVIAFLLNFVAVVYWWPFYKFLTNMGWLTLGIMRAVYAAAVAVE